MTRYHARRDSKYAVFLDGVEQRDVEECDDELGFVIRLRRDKDGHLLLNATRGEFLREIILGTVIVSKIMEGSR